MLFAGQGIFDLEYDENFNGFYYTSNGALDISRPYTPKITLYTIMFQSFVLMQVFNEINSRKLGSHEYNVFQGFFNNALFIFIILSTLAIQVAMVQYGGAAVRTVPLTLNQHLMCLGIGAFSLINGAIVKAILPVGWFDWIKIKEDPLSEEEIKKSLHMSLRKSKTIRTQASHAKVGLIRTMTRTSSSSKQL